MNSRKILIMTYLLILAVSLIARAADYEQSKIRTGNLSRDFDVSTYLDINELLCFIYNNGNYAYDQFNILGKTDGLYFPRGTNKTVVYAAGIWMGALVNGEVRTVVAEYGSEFVPGPMENGTYLPDNPDFRVYKIDGSSNAGNNPDYAEWPADMGAPVDEYGNPRLYGDQMCWSVFNDADSAAHIVAAGECKPLGVEVQQTSFAWARSAALGQTIFIKYLLINKGGNYLENTYLSLWADPDVGEASDDLVGCDTILSLGYCYNDAGTDNIYGIHPPAVGMDFLQGPIVPGNPADSAIFLGQWRKGYKNLPMTSFNKYINGTDPQSQNEAYNYMQGLLITGDSLIDPEGQVTTFYHAGDPVAGTGWLDNAAADRRFMLSTGPFNMAPGDTQEIVAALIVGQGPNRLASITQMKEYDLQIQEAYNNNFQIPLPPGPFAAYGRGLDGAIDLTWSSSGEDSYQNYLDNLGEFYVFEGYNIYQGESQFGPWHKFATYDLTESESQSIFEPVAGPYLIDCIEVAGNLECDSIIRPWNFNLIYNWIIDPEIGFPELCVVQEGSESGLEHHLQIDEDMIYGGPIINEQPYYFAVTRYSLNIEDVRSEDSVFAGLNFLGFNAANLESTINPLEIIPRGSPGISTDTAVHVAGNSDGLVVIEYLDPDALVSGIYQVDFNSDLTWNLGRAGLPLLVNQSNQGGDYDYPVVDGIMVRVIGPAPGIAPPANNYRGGIIEIANAYGPVYPDNVFWSPNSTTEFYVSSDFEGATDQARARFNWRGMMGSESWEFRFTAEGSEYYDWNGDSKFPDRAPLEVWHFNADDTSPDRRDIFFILDDDLSGGWSWGDRIYIAEVEYVDPLPEFPTYDYPANFHLGRVKFNNYGLEIPAPLNGTVVRFNSTRPNTVADIFEFEVANYGFCGDIDGDGLANITDAVYLINYIFQGGPAPYSMEAADLNCDGIANITDVVYMVNYIFLGGNAPCDPNGDGIADC